MPNDPYLDASVRWKIKSGQIGFHEPGYREVADAILESGVATEVYQRVGSGKEADVYLCRDDSRLVAVKAYRLFRTPHRGGGAIKLESMGQRASREFELLVYAWQDGARVPRPFRRVENLVSMEFLGNEDGPAPLLHHSVLESPQRFLRETLDSVERLAEGFVSLSRYFRRYGLSVEVEECVERIRTRLDRFGVMTD
jgi:serine/threonine-protein kinase RIO1